MKTQNKEVMTAEGFIALVDEVRDGWVIAEGALKGYDIPAGLDTHIVALTQPDPTGYLQAYYFGHSQVGGSDIPVRIPDPSLAAWAQKELLNDRPYGVVSPVLVLMAGV
jgi:hypothetical protein